MINDSLSLEQIRFLMSGMSVLLCARIDCPRCSRHGTLATVVGERAFPSRRHGIYLLNTARDFVPGHIVDRLVEEVKSLTMIPESIDLEFIECCSCNGHGWLFAKDMYVKDVRSKEEGLYAVREFEGLLPDLANTQPAILSIFGSQLPDRIPADHLSDNVNRNRLMSSN